MQQHQVLDRLLRRPDPARRLEADGLARLTLEVADRLQHHQADRERRGRRHLAGGGLDEVGARRHRQDGGPADVVVGAELARLQDHFQVGFATRLFDGPDLVVDLLVVAAEEGAAVDDHVDLVGAGFDRGFGLRDLDRREGLAGWEGGGHGGDLDAAAA